MRLAAVYMDNHEYLFNSPQIFNFGGRYIYSFVKDSDRNIILYRKENSNFIENFFGENIYLISAIVGENGTGKTSILTKVFNHLIPVRKGNEGLVFYIYEALNQTFYWSFFQINENLNLSSEGFKIEPIKDSISNFPIYFSNFFNENYLEIEKERKYSNSLNLSLVNQIISDFNSEPSPADFTFSFSRYNNAKLKRWMKLLSNEEVLNLLKHYNLPNFKNITIETGRIDLIAFNYRGNIESKLNHKGVEKLKNEYIKTVNLFEQINTYLHQFNSSFSGKKMNSEKKLTFLYKQVITYITRIILNQKNIFPKILDLKKFDSLNNPKEIIYNLSENLYFVDINDEKVNFNFPFIALMKLLTQYEIINNEDKNEIFDYKINLNFKDATKTLNLYEEFYLKVAEHFEVEYYQFLRFNPQKILSSGEEMMLNLISLLFENKNSQKPSALPFILFLDEADLGFHPNWKKKFIFSLAKVLPVIYKNRMIQIIFTTHEPLTLSDLPNNNVVYLIKKEGKTEVAKDSERPQKSFGANITDLLADSFFIEDGLIGDFAKGKINEVIYFLNEKEPNIQRKDEVKRVIEIIDEPLMKNKLLEMYFNRFPEEYDIEKEKEQIRKRAIELGLIPE